MDILAISILAAKGLLTFQFPYGNYFCLDYKYNAYDTVLTFLLFQFPYGNYFCLDVWTEDNDKLKRIIGECFNSLTGIIFVWTSLRQGTVLNTFGVCMFQFPYGNYFCLDLREKANQYLDISAMFQFPYGNYFCLDQIKNAIFGAAESAGFQFPYGNYFCLDGTNKKGRKI